VLSFSGGSNEVLNHSGGDYPENAEVTILQHSATGTLTTGVDRYDELFALSTTDGTIQLATSSGGSAITLTPGTAPVYIAARDEYTAVLSPDQMRITNLTHYGGKTSLQIPNPEGTHISSVWAYGFNISVLDISAYPGGSRSEPLSNHINTIYPESPQATALTASHDQVKDPFIHIEGKGNTLNTLQFRGESANVKRPRVEVGGLANHCFGVYALSSLSQAQPDVVVSGAGCIVAGLLHPNATVSNTGSNNKIHFIDENGNAEGANSL
jgi:hypothetical protein